MKQVRTLTSNLGHIKRKISADDGHFLQTGILYKYLAKKNYSCFKTFRINKLKDKQKSKSELHEFFYQELISEFRSQGQGLRPRPVDHRIFSLEKKFRIRCTLFLSTQLYKWVRLLAQGLV